MGWKRHAALVHANTGCVTWRDRCRSTDATAITASRVRNLIELLIGIPLYTGSLGVGVVLAVTGFVD